MKNLERLIAAAYFKITFPIRFETNMDRTRIPCRPNHFPQPSMAWGRKAYMRSVPSSTKWMRLLLVIVAVAAGTKDDGTASAEAPTIVTPPVPLSTPALVRVKADDAIIELANPGINVAGHPIWAEILRPDPRIIPARRWEPVGDRHFKLVTNVSEATTLSNDTQNPHPPLGEVATAADSQLAEKQWANETISNLLNQPTVVAPDQNPGAQLSPQRSNGLSPQREPMTSGRPTSTNSSSDHFAATSSIDEALRRPGSVTFRKTAINEVVFVLSDLWGINIVTGSEVTGDVSGTFRDAPLGEVLNAVLTSTGYGYHRIGESLIVLPIAQIPSQGNTNSWGSGGQSSPIAGGSRGASATGLASTMIPSGLKIQYFTLQFTEAEQMATPLQQALGQQVVVAVYPEENRLMIRGTAADMQMASEAIAQLDRPRSQVRITALIYDVALGETQNVGINWSRDIRGITDTLDDGIAAQEEVVSDFLAASSNLLTGGTSIGLRTIRDNQATSLLLEYLNATAESKLLADPSITVGNRHEASIRIVQKIPIITANPVENSNAVFTQTQFEEAGVILNVTPRISRDGTIEMQVKPEYSVVTEILASGPVIDSRTAETTVRVTDGQMFVLGGLRQKTIVETVRGIPVLKDLKFVGRLFRGHSTEVQESELIVFLKPEIVHTCSPTRAREVQAYRVGKEYLDRIPHAENIPQTPCCCDPNCPNHHPRVRINGGSYDLPSHFEDVSGGYPVEYPTECIHAGDSEYQVLPSEQVISQERPFSTTIPRGRGPGSFEPVSVEVQVN